MAGRRGQRATRAHGQHFLRSARLAAAIVAESDVGAGDLVVEFGAGGGRLTAPLADRGARVVAIEVDPQWAEWLRARFHGHPRVSVVESDALRVRLPDEPFRVVANVPFHITTALLRRLLDEPRTPLVRADLIVEWAVACKRARCWPSTLLNVIWGAHYELAAVRRLPAACFDPPPDADAGVLRVVRRSVPLVAARDATRFRAFVDAGFHGRGASLRAALADLVPPRRFKALARELGLAPTATARELDLRQWVTLFDAVSGR